MTFNDTRKGKGLNKVLFSPRAGYISASEFSAERVTFKVDDGPFPAQMEISCHCHANKDLLHARLRSPSTMGKVPDDHPYDDYSVHYQ